MAAAIVQALETFHGALGGVVITVTKGDLLSGEDPAVRQWPTKFGPPKLRQFGTPAPRVEAAVAPPGKRRGE